jgi:hypothetical protein
MKTASQAGWMAIGCVVGLALASGWSRVQAQGDETRRDAVQQALQDAQRNPAPRVLTGGDIGFQVRGMDGDTPVVVPMVRRNGEWVEASIGGGGIRKLTK